jgi:hypothetical protein
MSGPALDIVVSALLAATCCYCFVLNRRLAAVRKGQASLESAIAAFDAATRRAEESLAQIEKEGATTGRALSAVIARGDCLQQDLSVMVASGDRVAARIEAALGAVRAAGARR